VPDFVPLWNLGNYVTPETVAKDHKAEYDEIFSNNELMVEDFKEQGVRDEDLIYFYLSGNACNIYTTMNGRTLEWISRMRCCNKAQWEIRHIANSMVEQAAKVSPLVGEGLGPYCKVMGYCPEGKDSCVNRGVVVLSKKPKDSN
jgi:thymidylate synthase (FAD)